jgi:hypothetical protein
MPDQLRPVSPVGGIPAAAPPSAFQQASVSPLFHGRAELVQRYGKVEVVNGEIVTKGWESIWMTKCYLLGWPRAVYLNRDVVDRAVRLFARWQELGGYRIKSVGFFAPRAKRGNPGLLSLHTYGIAFDLNADDNPMQHPLTTDIPRAWLDAADAEGWKWGGDFPTPDPMHFQQAFGV